MPRKEDAIWNRFSAIYDRFMKKDGTAYGEIIRRITLMLKPEAHVLEIGTGTGIIALGLADCIRNIEAADFSKDMVEVARKKARQSGITNIHFSVQNACELRYVPESFDAVVICNTLHIMPEPEKALAEIKRVLKQEGFLIAPTFIHADSTKTAILSRLMSLTGFRAYHKWTQQSYHAFLKENGFDIVDSILIKASFHIAYVVVKQKQ
jgi:phosphatidylethanolamine/phosphatidyl-N-methylethanolamine N-methyltransferase